MADSDLPREISQFINNYITSVGQLEVLLLLGENPERSWSPEEVSQELRSNSTQATTQLKELSQSGLLVIENGRYHHSLNPQQIQKTSELKECYNTRRSTVINFIYSQPLEKIRGLANAFKIKKD